MDLLKYQWHFPENSPEIENNIKALQLAGLNYSPAFLRLCIQRGLNTKEFIEQATDQEPQLYHSPFLMFDMEKAINRLHQAIENNERILIYGDYDADGITSTLILAETLEIMGANFTYYLPNRLVDGYGPNLERYQEFVEKGVNLILTCDNGVAGFEAIDWAMSNGVDVIVSDHHEIQETLPNAYAIIHPRHPKGTYPFGELSGAGVALKLAHALLDELPTESLELAAIGTIADLVSLTDENRTIVLSGLNLMAETQRPGLLKLFENESVKLSEIDTDTVGFIIGPRLNAIGRLGDPTPALHLLQTLDEEEAETLLVLINEKNRQRQAIVTKIYENVVERINRLNKLPDIIIESDKSWPAGVLGIVASKICEKYHRPTILFEYQVESNRFRGSGRSFEGVHLFDWLSLAKETLAQFGGHSQAAGVTVNEKDWEVFKTKMSAIAKENEELLHQPSPLNIDLSLRASDLSEQLLNEISLLGPFGMDNPKPLITCDNTLLLKKREIGNTKQHIKFVIVDADDSKAVVEGIGFNKANLFEQMTVGDELRIAGYLTLNEWQGTRTVQIQLETIMQEGIQIRDFRASKFDQALLSIHNALFLCNNMQIKDWLEERLNASNEVSLYHLVNDERLKQFTHLVLVEPPNSLENFNHIMRDSNWEQLDLGVYLQESKWLSGMPKREEFAGLYRWLHQHGKEINIRENLSLISKQLSLPIPKLKCMISVFFEVGFVIIENGFASVKSFDSNAKIDLFNTDSFLKYQAAYQSEALLNYQTVNQIKTYINELRK